MIKKSKAAVTVDEAYEALCKKWESRIYFNYLWKKVDEVKYVNVPHGKKEAFNYLPTEVKANFILLQILILVVTILQKPMCIFSQP